MTTMRKPFLPCCYESSWRENESNGYGPIGMITGQAMLALSLIARCEVEIDQTGDQGLELVDAGFGTSTPLASIL